MLPLRQTSSLRFEGMYPLEQRHIPSVHFVLLSGKQSWSAVHFDPNTEKQTENCTKNNVHCTMSVETRDELVTFCGVLR